MFHYCATIINVISQLFDENLHSASLILLSAANSFPGKLTLNILINRYKFMDQLDNKNTVWQPSKKILFRFFFSYFFLYCFPFPIDGFDLLTPVAHPYYSVVDWLIPG